MNLSSSQCIWGTSVPLFLCLSLGVDQGDPSPARNACLGAAMQNYALGRLLSWRDGEVVQVPTLAIEQGNGREEADVLFWLYESWPCRVLVPLLRTSGLRFSIAFGRSAGGRAGNTPRFLSALRRCI